MSVYAHSPGLVISITPSVHTGYGCTAEVDIMFPLSPVTVHSVSPGCSWGSRTPQVGWGLWAPLSLSLGVLGARGMLPSCVLRTPSGTPCTAWSTRGPPTPSALPMDSAGVPLEARQSTALGVALPHSHRGVWRTMDGTESTERETDALHPLEVAPLGCVCWVRE